MTTIINNNLPVGGIPVQASSQDLDKQRQDAAALLEVARSLQETAGRMAAAGARDTQNQKGEISNEEIKRAMIQVMQLLANLQISIAQWGQEKSTLDADIGHLLSDAMRAKLDQAKGLMEDIAKSGGSNDFLKRMEGFFKSVGDMLNVAGAAMSGQPDALAKAVQRLEDTNGVQNFLKGMGTVLGMVAVAGAVATGQPQLAVVMATMVVLSESGALDKVTESISQGLQKQGMDPDKANVVAAALVVAASVVVTAGASAGASTVTASRAAANGAEAASAGSRAAQAARMGVVAGASAMGATNFSSYLATVAVAGMKDGSAKDVLTATIQIAVLMATIAAGLGAGTGGTSSTSFTTLARTLQQVDRLGYGLQVASTAVETKTQLDLANKTAELAHVQALIEVVKSNLDSTSKGESAKTQMLSSTLRSLSESIIEVGKGFLEGTQALTRALQS